MKLSFVRIFILHKLASTFSSLNIIRGSNHLIITLQRYDYYLDKNKLSRMNIKFRAYYRVTITCYTQYYS